MAKLGPKQQRFVEEYLIDLNATQAATRAGYAVNSAKPEKSAAEIGSQLLKKIQVADAIAKAVAERSKRTGINQDRIVEELAKIAFVNPTDVINMDAATIKGDANRDDTATIASLKVKTIPTEDGNIVEREVKTYDKIRALELLGKHLGTFKDKLEISGALGVTIVDDLK